MKIIIFEGICTSGKSSVIQKLKRILSERKLPCNIVTEDEVKKAMFANTDMTKSILRMEKFLAKNVHSKKNVLFDRLYLSLVDRCEQPDSLFKNLEERIIKHNASIVFLYIPPRSIKIRLSGASLHRGTKWKNYLDGLGGIEMATTYYSNQQKKILRYLKQCSVPHIIYNTESRDYEHISEKIYKTLIKPPKDRLPTR